VRRPFAPFPAVGDGRTPRLAALLVALLAATALQPTLHGDFLSDDFGYLALFHDKPLSYFLGLFHGDISGGIWGHPLDELRPVFALSYRLTCAAFGLSPAGHHALNVAVHVLNALLLFRLVLALTGGALAPSLLGAALFAVSPTQVPPVYWVTGRVETVATAFYLGTLLAFVRFRRHGRRGWQLLALLLFVLGLGTKEIVLTAPVILVALDVLSARLSWTRKLSLAEHLPFALVALEWVFIRRLVFGSAVRAERMGTGFRAILLGDQPPNLLVLLAPASADAAMATFSSWAEVLAGGLMAGALLGAAVLHVRGSGGSRKGPLAFCAVWYLVTLLPTFVTYWTPRHLYLPSCALYALVALLLLPPSAGSPRRTGPVLVGAGLVAAFLFLARTEGDAWGRLGETSRESRAAIARWTPAIPPGSAVVVSVPAMERRVGIWLYALPFAASPPFVSPGLYDGRQVVETPDLYCCPLTNWWVDRKPLLLEWTDPARPPLDLYVLYWSPNKMSVVMRHRGVRRDRLAARLEQALGAPLSEVREIDAGRGDAIVDGLREAAIAGARYGDPRGPAAP
jgi:hypothetical protein